MLAEKQKSSCGPRRPGASMQAIMVASSDVTATGRRRGPGRPWRAGQSGNPRGRPPRENDIAALARSHGPAGIQRLAELAGLTEYPPAMNEAVQAACIAQLLDR